MFGACHTRGTMPTLNTSKGRNPAGRGGGRASAALPLLDDVTASPPSRRLASARPALAPKCQLIFARTLRWEGVQNGELLRRAAGRFDVLVTMDRNLEIQQPLARQPFGIVLVRAA
jgi:hypothetical protein